MRQQLRRFHANSQTPCPDRSVMWSRCVSHTHSETRVFIMFSEFLHTERQTDIKAETDRWTDRETDRQGQREKQRTEDQNWSDHGLNVEDRERTGKRACRSNLGHHSSHLGQNCGPPRLSPKKTFTSYLGRDLTLDIWGTGQLLYGSRRQSKKK